MIRRPPVAWLAAAMLVMLAVGPIRVAGAVSVPTNFVVENAVSGFTFTQPVGLAFLPNGNYFVCEKRGRVYYVVNGVVQTTPVLNLEQEVLDNEDRGMLDVAVDPNFATNRYLYVLYVVDPNQDGNDTEVITYSRLTRYTLDTSNVAIASSRTILIGSTWTSGFPEGSTSHSIGTLRWGEDGSLLLTSGDGALFTEMDPGGKYPSLFGSGKTDPYEDIGAFRSQSLSSLAGKVLRINPVDGSGYSSNPFWDGNAFSKRSRIWAYGFRNPFRFTVRPGTGNASPSAGDPGSLFVGDVGWVTWEETNVARNGGINFGWPCYEGRYTNGSYQSASPAHNGCTSYGTSDNPASPTLPSAAWNHSDPNGGSPPGFIGNASIGGVFYTGTQYPTAYRTRYFFGDYGQNWIQVATYDSNDQLVSIQPFATNADAPVDFRTNPVTGDVYYVSITTNQVRRIRYTGPTQNAAPTAVVDANPSVGLVPLAVQFSSSGTFDPDNDPLLYAWDFGDGQASTSPNPSHTYQDPGFYNAVLTVDDSKGGVARDTIQIAVTAPGGFPSTSVLDNFNRADGSIGGSWVGTTAGLVITGNQLAQNSGYATTVWNGGVFGSTQEAFVTINALTSGATEHDLMLKIQGLTWDTGHIEVRYDADPKSIIVSTYESSQGWVHHGGPYSVPLVAGDRLGARAYGNGVVEVYRNSTLVASTNVSGWPFLANGGRVGMTIGYATQSRFDNFGGGNAVLNSNTRPHATIASPLNNSFYVAGDVISLSGSATDAQDPSSALQLRWEVDLHHNTHIHPLIYTISGPTGSFVGVNHDDGTGVYYEVRLIATDLGGLTDTARVNVYPRIDLTPSAIQLNPSTLVDTTITQAQFTIQNLAGMPAPISRWQLRLDGSSVAYGDTIVPALGSVTINRTVGPFPSGTHVLRAVVDTLGQVFETNESNNASNLSITVASRPPPAFPSAGVLDDFNRANAPLGAPWTAQTGGLAVSNNRLVQTIAQYNTVVWDGGVYGADQEVYVTLNAITASAPEHDVLLKVQGPSETAAQIEVRYDNTVGKIYVGTYTPGVGWKTWATITQTLAAGDVYGARAYANGNVDVYRNGAKIGGGSVVGWPYAGSGGRLGMTIANATASQLDNFGGGNVVFAPDVTPPVFVTGPTATPAGTSALITWTTNEPASGAVRYGLTTSLGDSVLTPQGTAGNATLNGLAKSTNYSYRVAATDGSGNTRLSALSSFTTLANGNPVAAASGAPTSGTAPLAVTFSSAGSGDPDGDPITYAWTFGDGGTSTAANPSHTYAAVGNYTAQLTVSDAFGGSGTASVAIAVIPAAFPTSPVVDNFNRADGAVGGSWVASTTTGLGISQQKLVQTGTASSYSPIWNGAVFGPDQEVFVTLSNITTSAPEHDVLLKVQGLIWSAGHIEVRYDAVRSKVLISTYDTARGWRNQKIANGITFQNGDVLGGRAKADGTVEVYRNATKVTSASVAGWPYAALGGRIGMTMGATTASKWDDFGGGNVGSATALALSPDPGGDSPSGSASAGTQDGSSPVASTFDAPRAFGLAVGIPNPVHGSASWALTLPHEGAVDWEIVDLQGRALWREHLSLPAGVSTLTWRSGMAPPGLYLAVARWDGRLATRRFVLIR